jgi:hypothetical protein
MEHQRLRSVRVHKSRRSTTTWRPGSGSEKVWPPEDDEADGLSEGERIMHAGNQWVREQLQPARPLRPSVLAVNPFTRDW